MHTPVFLGFYSHFWAEIAPGSGAGGNFFDLNIFCGDLSDFRFRFSPGAVKQGKICGYFWIGRILYVNISYFRLRGASGAAK